MAQMNIDLDRLGQIGQEDLTDEKTQKRLYQYLYQLSEQLKYWQYHMEEENMTEALREKIDRASDPNVKTMSTSITNDGIMIRDRDGSTVMTIGENGDLTVNSVTTSALTIGGRDLGTLLEAFLWSRIIVSETQPSARGVIWVQPQSAGSGASSVTYAVNGNHEACQSEQPTAFLFRKEGSDIAAGSLCRYGVYFRIQWGSRAGYVEHVKVEVSGVNAGDTVQRVTIVDEDRTEYVGAYGYLSVNSMQSMSGQLPNLTYGTGMEVWVTLKFADDATDRTFMAETMRLLAEGVGGGQQVRDCEVKYIS